VSSSHTTWRYQGQVEETGWSSQIEVVELFELARLHKGITELAGRVRERERERERERDRDRERDRERERERQREKEKERERERLRSRGRCENRPMN
jgi:hypothetical protein